MTESPLTEALRRLHDHRVPEITRDEAERATSWSPPRPRRMLVAVAAVIVLLALGIVARQVVIHDGQGVVASRGQSGWCSALAARAHVGRPLVVYLVRGADPAEVEAVGATLSSESGVEVARYYDADAAVAEARILFADQPSVGDLLDPSTIPTSFRVQLSDGSDERTLRAELEGMSAVQQVEVRPSDEPDGATGAIADDRVVDRLGWLAQGGPTGVAADRLEALQRSSPDDLSEDVASVSPLLDEAQPAEVPTAAQRTAATVLVRAAEDRCDLPPR